MRRYRAFSAKNGRTYTFYNKSDRDNWIAKDQENRRPVNGKDYKRLWYAEHSNGKKYIN